MRSLLKTVLILGTLHQPARIPVFRPEAVDGSNYLGIAIGKTTSKELKKLFQPFKSEKETAVSLTFQTPEGRYATAYFEGR